MSAWAGRRVLVTGAGGFIGSHLTERLVQEGATVRAFVHYNSSGTWGWLETSDVVEHMEVVPGDVADAESVLRACTQVDVVFHLAALIGIPYSYVAPASYVRTNVDGTLNVLQAARSLDIERVLVTSTSEVYGSARAIPMDESHPIQAQSPYSATKVAADALAEAFHRSFGLPVVVVRPFNTYGPRQSARAVIPTIITQALTSGTVSLGNTTPTRDLTFVSDTVGGFLAAGAVDGVSGEVINLGSGTETSIRQIVEAVARLTGRSVDVIEDAARIRADASEVTRLCADTSKASAKLGWRPTVSFEDGLARTIGWIGSNLDAYKPSLYGV